MGSPNCYTCQYRGTLLGDCHSRCRHPLVESALEGKESLVDLVSLLASGKRGGGADLSGPGSPLEAVCKALGIKGNPHGIAHNWFSWPMNYDPIWLESCNGHKEKE